MLLCHGERSLFGHNVDVKGTGQVYEENDIMFKICEEYGLDAYYHEAGMALWRQIRSEYRCEIFTYGAQRYLAICLGLAIKFAGPKSTTHGYCTLRNMARYWKYLSLDRLQSEELKMCRLLNWQFR